MSKNGILNQPVLLLNVNYEPLHVCNTKRALMLVYTGKAEIILNGRGYLRTVRDTFEIPSVIRLSYMVKRPRPRVTFSKREVLRRDNYTCQYCGRKSSHLTIDHVIPRYRNGRHTWKNVVAACAPCNRAKGGRSPQEANMKLLRQPFEPSPTATYIFGTHLQKHQEWSPYIEGW